MRFCVYIRKRKGVDVIVKITKKQVTAGSDCCGKCNHKQSAISHIKAAMDELALVDNDPVCQDSIANLSVVFIDLCPCKDESDTDVPDTVDSMGTFTKEGMVE